ncbi:hypothetical protein H310_00766 [Aphanomyces invadans]|uniref:J domain-containing protein n=1 Tax=Aphanomyces invadans TaxID=157072 RepID=A0A024UVW6_9STRA|nr:hypothetical protein H310_00766 [Aphanomyces invadans]ETW10469.1 hypothetical protein H310_00766 [Aphanomyces invadans]|eukprot:XP_008861880.1 hypothetical protein H310_00766 [Aphanomyces invadans]
MAPRHTKLYDVMGVAPNVTQEELKKAYRRKALQLHPDKRGNTPEAQEEFTIMKSAYDILSDPKQRDIYDMMGEDGVKLVHQYGDLRPDELLVAMLNSLAQSGPLGKCIIFSFVAVFVGFFILIPLFVCLKVDQDIGWSWLTVFTPMWILDGIFLCCVGCSIFEQDPDIHQDTEHRPSPFVRIVLKLLLLLKGLAFVGFQLLVAMKLQGGIPNIDVPIVFAPYFVLEGFYLVEKIIAGILSYSAFAAATAAGPSVGTGQSRATLVLEIVNSWVMSVLRLAFGVLVAFKLDDALDISWWVAFVPVWIYTATLVVPHVLAYVRHKKTAPSTNSADDTSAGPSLGGLLCLIVGTLVFMSPFFILAYRLQSGDFSSFYVLLPWLIVVGLVLLPWILMVFCGLLSCFCQCCCSHRSHDGGEETSDKATPKANHAPTNHVV